MKRANYWSAVNWIALNDNPGENESIDELAISLTVLLVADLFGIDADKVATDVWAQRQDVS